MRLDNAGHQWLLDKLQSQVDGIFQWLAEMFDYTLENQHEGFRK